MVDVSDKAVLLGLLVALIRHALFHNRLQIAVEEVEAWNIVPWLENVTRKDNHLIVLQHLSELLVLQRNFVLDSSFLALKC